MRKFTLNLLFALIIFSFVNVQKVVDKTLKVINRRGL